MHDSQALPPRTRNSLARRSRLRPRKVLAYPGGLPDTSQANTSPCQSPARRVRNNSLTHASPRAFDPCGPCPCSQAFWTRHGQFTGHTQIRNQARSASLEVEQLGETPPLSSVDFRTMVSPAAHGQDAAILVQGKQPLPRHGLTAARRCDRPAR